MRCNFLCFDMDGVLVDSSACIERIYRDWARQYSLDGDMVVQYGTGQRTVDAVRRAAPHLDAELEATLLENIAATNADGTIPINGARELIASLRHNTFIIVTSASRATAECRLRAAGLPVPLLMITADDVHEGKPSPAPYITASSQLRAQPHQCIVFEDSEAGIISAKAAGMRVVGIGLSSRMMGWKVKADVVVQDLSYVRVEYDPAGEMVLSFSERGQ